MLLLNPTILQTQTVNELISLLEEACQFLTGKKKSRTERQRLYDKIASVMAQHEIALQDIQFFGDIPHKSILKIMKLPVEKRMKTAKRLQQYYRSKQ